MLENSERSTELSKVGLHDNIFFAKPKILLSPTFPRKLIYRRKFMRDFIL